MQSTSPSSTNGVRALTLEATAARAHPDLPAPIDESTARLIGAVGVAGVAVIHILDSVATYHSTRYIFWLYIALIASAMAVHARDRRLVRRELAIGAVHHPTRATTAATITLTA